MEAVEEPDKGKEKNTEGSEDKDAEESGLEVTFL